MKKDFFDLVRYLKEGRELKDSSITTTEVQLTADEEITDGDKSYLETRVFETIDVEELKICQDYEVNTTIQDGAPMGKTANYLYLLTKENYTPANFFGKNVSIKISEDGELIDLIEFINPSVIFKEIYIGNSNSQPLYGLIIRSYLVEE